MVYWVAEREDEFKGQRKVCSHMCDDSCKEKLEAATISKTPAK